MFAPSYNLSRKLLFLYNFRRLSSHVYRTVATFYKINDASSRNLVSEPSLRAVQLRLSQIRNKYSGKSSKEDEDSDSDEDQEDFKDGRDSKVVRAHLNSLRADLIVKAGLGLARNKVEVAFYESKIRVNGEKLPKKSIQLKIGDEVDLVKGFSSSNPAFLVVSRVEILSAKEKDENLLVQMRRYKSLLVENYAGPNIYRSSDS